MPINTHVTINFAATCCHPKLAVPSFSLIRRHHHGKWATRHPRVPHAATGAYAFENVRDGEPFLTMDEGDPHNVHTHWALHVPPALWPEFEGLIERWVSCTTGGETQPNAVKITHPPPHRMRRYLLKGIAEGWAEIYKATAEPQGIVTGGRRSGVTANLGPSQRRALDRLLGVRRRVPARPTKNAVRA